MVNVVWSIVGGVLGTVLALIVTLLTHRVTHWDGQHEALDTETARHFDDLRHAIQGLTRDVIALQTALSMMQNEGQEHHARLLILEATRQTRPQNEESQP